MKIFKEKLIAWVRNRDEGVVALIYALALIPIFGMVGLTIDAGRDYYAHSIIAGATDAAAVSGAKAGGTPENMVQQATRMFNANIPENFMGTVSGPSVTVSADNRVITVTATATIDTTFMKILGQNTISASATSQAQIAIQGAEIVLALDNTGSMAGSPMSAEIQAATDLVNIVYGGAGVDTVDGLYVGVVPYTTTVNIGMSGFDPTSWLTSAGQAQVQNLNLFPNIPPSAASVGGSWMGCIEARAPRPLGLSASTYSSYGYTNYAAGTDTSDIPPTSDATRFVPFFYPSTMVHGYVFGEPVNRGTTSTSTTALASPGSPPWGSTGSTRGDNDWRLDGTVPSGSGLRFGDNYAFGGDGNMGVGPNLGCPIPLLPLTESQTTVQSTISNMKATFRGGTMINLGLNVAWWMLSPQWTGMWPGSGSSLPQTYGDTLKVIVLMTDGQNQWYDWPGGVPGRPNTSSPYQADADYTGFGRLAEGRSGTTNFGSTVTLLNNRMLNMCSAIKNNDIVIYTIIYTHGGSVSGSTQATFQSCATDSSKYFFAATSADLQSAFQDIGRDISNLRLTWPGTP